jgi:hypothetical protein
MLISENLYKDAWNAVKDSVKEKYSIIFPITSLWIKRGKLPMPMLQGKVVKRFYTSKAKIL